jgi:hypothetical protein
MKKLFLIAGLICILFSCTEKEEKPSVLLSKEKMIEILSDVHISEAVTGIKNLDPDSAKKLFDAYEKSILAEHNIDKSIFDASYQYYIEQPELMDEIYAAVVDTLSLKEGRGKIE